MNNTNPDAPGFIYVLKANNGIAEIGNDIYKIGLSVHPEDRLKEIQKGLAPFIRIEMVFNLPVSNMRIVEAKLHNLYWDKNISGEWFCLYPQDIEAIKSLADQISDIVRPKRVPRTRQHIRFDLPSVALTGTAEPVARQLSELESAILGYIHHTRNALSKKLTNLLNEKVVAGGNTYESPEYLWANDPQFRVWVERKLVDLQKLPGMNPDRAVYSIRDYANEKYGWIKVSPREPEIKDLPYGE